MNQPVPIPPPEPNRATQQRLIVPDLARGTALWGIALANASTAWIVNDWTEDHTRAGWSVGGVRPGNLLDEVCAVLAAMFVHVRGLPMFSTLLGFGFGLVAASLARKGYTSKEARRVLLRRYGALALFGLAHMLLLFYGDIMLTYGLIGVLLALMFTLSGKVLRIIAYTILTCFTLLGTLGAAATYFFEDTAAGMDSPGDFASLSAYFAANFRGGLLMLVNQPFAVAQLGALTIIGYLWARERVLIDVAEHRKTLITWTVIGAAVVLCIGLPWGLAAAGVLPPELEMPFYMLNQGFGMFTGPGILAALALATDSLRNEVPAWARAFVALGKRSMSGYLAQSFLFVAIVMPFGLGLAHDAPVSGQLGAGTLVWLITLALAVLLDRAGKQGPFEWAHRHVSYGTTGRIEPKYDRVQIPA